MSRKHRIQIYFIAELLCIDVATQNRPLHAKQSSYLVVSSSDEAARLEPVLSPVDSSSSLTPREKCCVQNATLVRSPSRICLISCLLFTGYPLAFSIYCTFFPLKRVNASRRQFRFRCRYCKRTVRNSERFEILTAAS